MIFFPGVLALCLGLYFVESIPDVLIAERYRGSVAKIVVDGAESFTFRDDYFYHRIRHIIGNEIVYSSEFLDGYSKNAVYDEIEDCIYYNILRGSPRVQRGDYDTEVFRRCKSTEYKIAEEIVDRNEGFLTNGQMSFDWIGRNLIDVYGEGEEYKGYNLKIGIKSLKNTYETAIFSPGLSESLEKKFTGPVSGTLVVDSESNYLFFVTVYSSRKIVVRCDLRFLGQKSSTCKRIHDFSYSNENTVAVKMEADLAKKELVVIQGYPRGGALGGPYIHKMTVIQMDYNGENVTESTSQFVFPYCHASGISYTDYTATSMFVHDGFVYWTGKRFDRTFQCHVKYMFPLGAPMGIFGASLTSPDEGSLLYKNYGSREHSYISWMKTTAHSAKQLKGRCGVGACHDTEICLANSTSEMSWVNNCVDPVTLKFREGEPVLQLEDLEDEDLLGDLDEDLFGDLDEDLLEDLDEDLFEDLDGDLFEDFDEDLFEDRDEDQDLFEDLDEDRDLFGDLDGDLLGDLDGDLLGDLDEDFLEDLDEDKDLLSVLTEDPLDY